MKLLYSFDKLVGVSKMIDNLYIKNYRAFEEIDIDFSKINLFFGPNNSGKSSLLSAITLLSQTLQIVDSDVPLLLNGKNENLGTYRDIVYKNDVKRSITIGVGLTVEFSTPRTKKKEVQGYFEVQFNYRPIRREIIVEKTKTEIPKGVIKSRSKRTSSGGHHLILIDQKGNEIIKKLGKRGLDYFQPKIPRRFSHGEIEIARDPLNFNFHWGEMIEDIEYICPFREPPRRTYLFSGQSPISVGPHGDKAVNMMVMDSLRKGKETKSIIKKVAEWLSKAEISRRVELKILTDRHFEIKLQQFITREKENLVDVGSGCSQILPILVAGFNLEDNEIFIVEEPEIHLHPKAQAELGSFFYTLSKKNIQTFIETHSEHLLLRIQRHVAQGDLKPEDVKLYYVYANKKTKRKEIEEIKLNENGTFSTEWPEGFFPERLIEAKKMAKASLDRGG